MRDALVQMKPNHIEDIIALVALYRPGPMSNIPIYNDCKHGRQTPDCMVLYGIVWYGMVWYGMVWYGMVRDGMGWDGMVWDGGGWDGKV